MDVGAATRADEVIGVRQRDENSDKAEKVVDGKTEIYTNYSWV